MILPPSTTRARPSPQIRSLKRQPSRKTNVQVTALFGGKASATPSGGGGVEDLRDVAKRAGGPSEKANQAIAKAVRPLRYNKLLCTHGSGTHADAAEWIHSPSWRF